ncbi:MAG: RNA methyltransferase [bacterium]|nr:RNA methyltransferase [bacterium]
MNNIYIILVEPRVPENIGAAARAMKNMGFKHLRLVNPEPYKNQHTYAVARKGKDIVNKAKVFLDIKAAIKDLDLIVGTTSKGRMDGINHFTAAEAAGKIIDLGRKNKIGMLFGRERTGLTNMELRHCSIVSRIPQPAKNFSLNLAQSIMVYCYELYMHSTKTKVADWDLAQDKDMQRMYDHLAVLLGKTTFKASGGIPKFVHRFRRIFGRTPLENRDVQLLHKLFSIMEYHLDGKKSCKDIGD